MSSEKVLFPGTDEEYDFVGISDVSFSDDFILSFKAPLDYDEAVNFCLCLLNGFTWTETMEFIDGCFVVDLSSFVMENEYNDSSWYCSVELKSKIVGVGIRSSGEYYFTRRMNHRYGIYPFISRDDILSFSIGKYEVLQTRKTSLKTHLTKFKIKDSILKLKLVIINDESIDYSLDSLVLKYRSDSENIEYNIPITNGELVFEIDLKDYSFKAHYWDLYLLLDVNGEGIYLRVMNPEPYIKKTINYNPFKNLYITPDGFAINAYVSKNNSFSLIYQHRDPKDSLENNKKENLAYYLSKLLKHYYKRKNIWLLFEKKSETAQDNAFYLFKYYYENHPEKNVYYIIDKNSEDYGKLDGMYNRVLEHMSFKYMLYVFVSRLFISSEARGHAYLIRTLQGRLRDNVMDKPHVFLQHGVTAFKRVDYIFGKRGSNKTDLFVTTSQLEKEIIYKYFDYRYEQIILTGFCRWDYLEDESHGKEILLMPTWRKGLEDVEDGVFLNSTYYKNYSELLKNPELLKLLEDNNIRLNIRMHPKLEEFIDKFNVKHPLIHFCQADEKPVNELLMENSLLITDYSSVSWDMYYQKKPVLFYQFDYDEYEKTQGSYINMEKELFGDRYITSEDLISGLQEYIANSFQEKEKYSDMRQYYLEYCDHDNCQRTYDAIESHQDVIFERLKVSNMDKIKNNNLIRLFWRLMERDPYIDTGKMKRKFR